MDQAGLQADSSRLGVPLDDGQADLLLRYVALLERWNARFNLVSRRDIKRIWPRHILDSLSIAPLLADAPQTQVFDIGTGAGLPGLPLAITLPQISWLLLDRNQRKIRFLETVITDLGLTNVQARVADLGRRTPADLCAGSGPDAGADVVISRAVDDPVGLLTLAAPLLKPTGRMVLMTGTRAADPAPVESPAADPASDAVAEDARPIDPDSGFFVSALHELTIPGLDRTHEVTIIERELTKGPDE